MEIPDVVSRTALRLTSSWWKRIGGAEQHRLHIDQAIIRFVRFGCHMEAGRDADTLLLGLMNPCG